MSRRYVHTCLRVRDPEASVRFYGALGFEPRGRLNFSSAYNVYLGLPGDGDVLELTVNRGQQEPYDLGTGYNHMRSRSTTSTRRSPTSSRSECNPRSLPPTRATARSCR